MKRFCKALMLFCASLAVGCAGSTNMPLVFGQSQVVGISIGGSSIEQRGDFTLGYKDVNFAVVPVTVKQSGDASTQIKSTADSHTDALSVLGQFEVNADQAKVGLGKFFATGLAAKRLADGFASKLGALRNESP